VILAFLGTLGVVPGVEVTVVEKHPFDGPLVVRIDGHTRTIGERVARQVYVTRTLPAGQDAHDTHHAGDPAAPTGGDPVGATTTSESTD
jgi:hypothetical protein